MATTFDIIQGIMALGIVIFSIVSIYYGARTIIIHIKIYGKLMDCCWIMILKTIIHISFGLIFFDILLSFFGANFVYINPEGFDILVLEPIIFLNSMVNSIYIKRDFLEANNLKKLEVFKNGQ